PSADAHSPKRAGSAGTPPEWPRRGVGREDVRCSWPLACIDHALDAPGALEFACSPDATTAGHKPGCRLWRLSTEPKLPDYRFENWKRRRAPRWPYFLRSFMRLSRVRKPFSRRAPSAAPSKVMIARA